MIQRSITLVLILPVFHVCLCVHNFRFAFCLFLNIGRRFGVHYLLTDLSEGCSGFLAINSSTGVLVHCTYALFVYFGLIQLVEFDLVSAQRE